MSKHRVRVTFWLEDIEARNGYKAAERITSLPSFDRVFSELEPHAVNFDVEVETAPNVWTDQYDLCKRCGDAADGGEGYGGCCGNCADRSERGG